jgi:hypothetical protein
MALIWGLAGSAAHLLGLLLFVETATLGVLLLIVHSFLLCRPGPSARVAAPRGGQRAAHAALVRGLLIFLWAATFASLLFFWAAAAGFHAWRTLSLPGLSRAAGRGAGVDALLGPLPLGLSYGVGLSMSVKLLLPPLQFGVLLFYQRVTPTALGVYLSAYYVYVVGALLLYFGVQLGAALAPWLGMVGCVVSGLALLVG